MLHEALLGFANERTQWTSGSCHYRSIMRWSVTVARWVHTPEVDRFNSFHRQIIFKHSYSSIGKRRIVEIRRCRFKSDRVQISENPNLAQQVHLGWRFIGFSRWKPFVWQTVNARFSQPTFGIGRKGCTVSKVRNKANRILFALFMGVKIEYV